MIQKSRWIETPMGMFLSEVEAKEYGIVSDIEKSRGWPNKHLLAGGPHLIVVHWSHSGLSYEDPEDLEMIR